MNIGFIKEKFGEDLYSVYVKGTYVMGEMTEDSDVDLVVIFKENSREVFSELKGHMKFGNISISGFSLEELRTGVKKGKGSSPKNFMRMVEYYKLLYGQDVSKKNFPQQSKKESYDLLKEFIKQEMLPNYKIKYGFSDLVKACLWLEFNHLALSKDVNYSYKYISNNTDKELVKKAYKYKFEKPNEEEKEIFLKKFEKLL